MRAAPFVLLLLAGCAATPPPAPIAAPIVYAPIPGLERVIGAPERTAIAVLGTPTLDRREGLGHHLQFARAACILDLYYFPDATGQPAARFAEARTHDGKPQDAGACFLAQTAPVAKPAAPPA